MALSTGSSKLSLTLKELRLRWEETKNHWNDPVSQAFDDNHIGPLEAQVIATLRGIDRLAQVLTRAQSECG